MITVTALRVLHVCFVCASSCKRSIIRVWAVF